MAGRGTREQVGIRTGDRYVWMIPQINFGPIFMEVVPRRGRARAGGVYFRCIGPNGEPFKRTKRVDLPLPPAYVRLNWTDEDVRRAAEGGR